MNDNLLPNPELLPSNAEMAAYDARTIAGGVPALVLMERAGAAITEVLERHLSDAAGRRITLLCGPGNNGGDGLVIARLLHQRGYEVRVVVVSADGFSKECMHQLKAASVAGVRMGAFPHSVSFDAMVVAALSDEALSDCCIDCDLIVDALLGTGQKSAPRGPLAALLHAVHHALAVAGRQPFVAAVDLPTGIDGDSGGVYEGVMVADLSVTIECAKRGMVQFPAAECCGTIVPVSIGLRCDPQAEFLRLGRQELPRFPPRPLDAHKGEVGRILLLAGSRDMPGAAALSANAALHCGSGLVSCCTQASWRPVGLAPEVIARQLPGDGASFDLLSVASIRELMRRVDVAALGPGLGEGADLPKFVSEILALTHSAGIPTVLDADGLNALSQIEARDLKLPMAHVVMTPHPGEAARLLGMSSESVQNDRYTAAKMLAAKYGAVVILKGARTVIYADRKGWVNFTGSPWMASPGMGDVLTGMVASLIGQGLGLSEAARLGVYLHGRAGELSHSAHHGPIVASDLIAALPRVIGAYRSAEAF